MLPGESMVDQTDMDIENLKAAIVADIIALKTRYPHFENLTEAHFQADSLQYENGRQMVPNPDYQEQLEGYYTEKKRREEEDRAGLKKKRRVLSKPSEIMTSWNKDNGIEFRMRFTAHDPDYPKNVRTAVTFPIPGYEAINLESTGFDFEAQVGSLHIHFIIQGGENIKEIREAVFQVLLFHAGV